MFYALMNDITSPRVFGLGALSASGNANQTRR